MKTIKLNKPRLEDFIYEFTSSDFFDDGEGVNEQLWELFTKAQEEAYVKYKKKFGEDPEYLTEPDFANIVAEFFPAILWGHFTDFCIEEEIDEQDSENILSARFTAVKNGERVILIEEIWGKMVYGWGPE